MAFIDIHQNHIFRTNTAPCHVHHIDFSILAVGCYRRAPHRMVPKPHAQRRIFPSISALQFADCADAFPPDSPSDGYAQTNKYQPSGQDKNSARIIAIVLNPHLARNKQLIPRNTGLLHRSSDALFIKVGLRRIDQCLTSTVENSSVDVKR